MRKMKILAVLPLLAMLSLPSCSKDEPKSTTLGSEELMEFTLDVPESYRYEYDDSSDALRALPYEAVDHSGRPVPELKIPVGPLRTRGRKPDAPDNTPNMHLKFAYYTNSGDAQPSDRDALDIASGNDEIGGSYLWTRARTVDIEEYTDANGKRVQRLRFRLYFKQLDKFFKKPGTWAVAVAANGHKGQEPEVGFTVSNGFQPLEQWYSNNAGYDVDGKREYFTTTTGANKGSYHKNPNRIVEEVKVGQTSQREFPLMTYWVEARYFKYEKLKTGNSEYNDNEADRAGIAIGEVDKGAKVTMHPRGSIFSFRLDNQTGKTITIEDIEMEYDKGFAFNGAYRGRYAGIGQEFPFYEQKAMRHTETSSGNARIARFPMRANGGTAKVSLTSGAQSEGVFFVWTHVLDATKPFKARIRYTEAGSTAVKTAKTQSFPAPSTGYKEGKSYYAVFKIKPN